MYKLQSSFLYNVQVFNAGFECNDNGERKLRYTGVEQSGDEGSVNFVPNPPLESEPERRCLLAGAGLRSQDFLDE